MSAADYAADSGSAISAIILAGRPVRRLSWEDGIVLAPGSDGGISWFTHLNGVVTDEVPLSSLGQLDLVAVDWIIL